MEAKQAALGSVPAGRDLEVANEQISTLYDSVLPPEPHLLLVSSRDASGNFYPQEHERTPFENYEVRHLQYMTLCGEHNRGLATTKSGWEEEMEAMSPRVAAARSQSTTPAHTIPRPPAKKMKFADYKNLKNGIQPSPKSGPGDIGDGSTHSRRNSDLSSAAPMSRGPSFEGPSVEGKHIGASASINTAPGEKTKVKDAEKPVIREQSSNRGSTNEHLSAATNGQDRPTSPAAVSPQPKFRSMDVSPPSLDPRYEKERAYSGNYHSQSPSRKFNDAKRTVSQPKQLKRPHESAEFTPPEKRTKIGHPVTPSTLPKNLPPKPNITSEAKQSSSKLTSQSSPQAKRITPTKKIDTKAATKSSQEKPLELPPLLSPLPADLDDGPLTLPRPKPSSLPNGIKSGSAKISTHNLPPKPPVAYDTIVVKKHHAAEKSPLSTPPKSSGPRVTPLSSIPTFVLPPLLSPILPDIVEQELERLHQKTLKEEKSARPTSLNTVEARHEKVRRPDAPGVARKTVQTKLGHPPKKNTESSRASGFDSKKNNDSLIIKLKFKKRMRNDIQRILGVRPRPNKDFLRLEAERRENERQASSKIDEDSEEDVPLASISKTAAPLSKKRVSDVFDSRATEPAAKRARALDTIDVAKSRASVEASFKSPALSGPGQKNLLTTPRKGEGMKSAAMHKVNSNDGHARTPQNANASTPASAEKPRINGDTRNHNPDYENVKADERKYSDKALRLKRKMDEILQTKIRNPRLVSDTDNKLGLTIGLESFLTYMLSWQASEKATRKKNATGWEQGLGLWDFLEQRTRQIPVLHNLTEQVGALLRTELNRAYMEASGLATSSTLIQAMAKNSSALDRLWVLAHKSRTALKDLEIVDTVGPWLTVTEGVSYVMDVLERFSKHEKLGWKRE